MEKMINTYSIAEDRKLFNEILKIEGINKSFAWCVNHYVGNIVNDTSVCGFCKKHNEGLAAGFKSLFSNASIYENYGREGKGFEPSVQKVLALCKSKNREDVVFVIESFLNTIKEGGTFVDFEDKVEGLREKYPVIW